MSEHLHRAIADLESKLAEQLKAAAKTKAGINQLAELAGMPPPYPDVEERSGTSAIRPDQFYGQPLHTAMRGYVELRGKTLGPATVNEIFEALQRGGYQFDTKNDENSKRIIRITLTKNSVVFHKLPNGAYGLLAWYPNARAARSKTNKQANAAEAEIDSAESEDGVEDDEGPPEKAKEIAR